MAHASAVLTPAGRLRLARCVVEQRWPLRRAAERFGVSHSTAGKWAARYRRHGRAGLVDRSSRPHRCPHQLPARTERRIVGLRVSRPWGAARIAYRLRLNPATVARVLARYGCPPLRFIDPATGVRIKTSRRTVIRYEHPAPGDLVHVDTKKLGRIPDGGGHRVVDRLTGRRNRPAGGAGYAVLHSAVDDHSRLAYSEILADERMETTAAFWRRAQAWFGGHGITVRRVLTDNGNPYRSALFRAALGPEVTHRRCPAVSAADQRQGRALSPDPARGVGLRPPLCQRDRTDRGLRCLPPRLQPPPRALRTPRPITRRPRQQPGGSVHLGRALAHLPDDDGMRWASSAAKV